MIVFPRDEANRLAHVEPDLAPLPLWKFHSPTSTHQPVTALCWSPAHPDLLAIAYGTFSHLSLHPGRVSCFSLKNPTNPEYSFELASGATSVDFNKLHPHLLAVGMAGGAIAVFDMRHPGQGAVTKGVVGKDRSVQTGVSKVKWHPKDSLGGDPRLYTVSGNGCVQLWEMGRNGLVEEVG